MPHSAVPVIDGLALPAFVDLAARLPQPWVALVHHPLALETGLTPAEAQAFADLERRLLAGAARVIATSPGTRRDLAAYDLDAGRIGVVCPGTDPAPLARGSTGPGLELLCVASLTPRKGHLVLLEALAELRALDWRLICVGSAERDPACALEIARALDRFGLRERVRLVGERGRGRARAVLRRRRSVRARLVPRGLRHGARRSARARPRRWSRPRRARFPTPCRMAPGCWCRPATRRPWPRRCAG